MTVQTGANGSSAATSGDNAVMRTLREMRWPMAIVMLGAFAFVFALVYWAGVPLKDIGIAAGAAGGVYTVWMVKLQSRDTAEVKTQVNGNNEALRKDLRDALDRVAESEREKTAMVQEFAKVLAQVTVNLPSGSALPSSLADEPPKELAPTALR